MARAWIAAGMVAGLLAGGLIDAPAGEGGEYTEGPYTEYDEGVDIGTVIQRDLDPHEPHLMRAAGIDSVRFWLDWSEVESERGEFYWFEADEAIRKMAGAGLTPVPFLFGTPAWAAQADKFECDRTDCAPYAPSSLQTREAFASFAGAAARRYGRDGNFWAANPRLPYQPIRAWQIWNEPNLQAFWRPWVDAIGYAELVRLAAEQIRAEDRRAEVLLAGVSGGRTTMTRWSPQVFLHRFYDVPDIAASFDGVTVHPYAARMRGVLERVSAIRAVVDIRDPDADLWVTEIGWASAGSREWTLVKSRRRQADLLRRAYTRLLGLSDDWNLRGIYWYAWRDTERGKAVCGWCGKAGLRDRDGKAKPAYRQLRRLTR